MLVDRMHVDEPLQVLALEALDIAARTADQRKRRLAGRVVGRATIDSAHLDPAHLVTRALANLETWDLRVLAEVREIERNLVPDEFLPPAKIDPDDRKRLKEATAAVRQHVESYPEPIATALRNSGCVREHGAFLGEGTAITGTTAFGRELLKMLENEVTDD